MFYLTFTTPAGIRTRITWSDCWIFYWC